MVLYIKQTPHILEGLRRGKNCQVQKEQFRFFKGSSFEGPGPCVYSQNFGILSGLLFRSLHLYFWEIGLCAF